MVGARSNWFPFFSVVGIQSIVRYDYDTLCINAWLPAVVAEREQWAVLA